MSKYINMKKKGLEQVKPKALSTYKGTGQP